jgi:hypothetical protein
MSFLISLDGVFGEERTGVPAPEGLRRRRGRSVRRRDRTRIGVTTEHRRRALNGGVDDFRRRRPDADPGERRLRVLQSFVQRLAIRTPDEVQRELSLVGGCKTSLYAFGHQPPRAVVIHLRSAPLHAFRQARVCR